MLKGLNFIMYEIGAGKVPSGITALVVNRNNCNKFGTACFESGIAKPIKENNI